MLGRTSPPKVMNHSHGWFFFPPTFGGLAEPCFDDVSSDGIRLIADQRSFCRKTIVP